MNRNLTDTMTEVAQVLDLYSYQQGLLEAYSKEIGVACDIITVQELIHSHRRLREQSMRGQDEIRAELERVAEATRKSILDDTYIKKADLKTMTIQQIMEALE